MLKALSVRIWRVGASLCSSRVRVMAESSALLIVCRSSWDFISMWMVIPVLGFTMDAPSLGIPVFLSVRIDEVFWVPRSVEFCGSEWIWCVWRTWRVLVLFRVSGMAVYVFGVLLV